MPEPIHPDMTGAASPESPAAAQNTAVRAALRQSRRHWEMLVISILVIVLSLVLQVQPDGDHVAPGIAPSLILPGTCISRELFGFNCPGCGLTRSFILLAHGDFAGSYRMHRVGWVLALAVLAQIPYRSVGLWELARSSKDELQHPTPWRRLPQILGYLLITLLIGNWLFNLLTQ